MLTMDTFYEDQQHTITKMKLMKNKMTLDFNSPVSSDKMTKLKTCILESPDLKMLKLASPELERLIIGQSGMVTTTPTPSSTLPYYLKQEHQPTEEQEQYAKGFVDALNQLHQTNGQPSHHHMNIDTNNNQNNHTHSHSHNLSHGPTADHSSDLTLTDLNNGRRNSFHVPVTSEAKFAVPSIPSTVPTTASSHTEHYVSVSSGHTNGAHVMINTRSTPLPPYSQAVNNNFYSPMPIKVEPNHCQPKPMRMSPPMVDPLSPQSDTASLTRPIDMADQERIKLERKRLRNRIAASKCRRRKLERISKLEDKVKVLKGENSELSVVVGKLRDQACSLKQQIMDHVKCGCQLMVPQ